MNSFQSERRYSDSRSCSSWDQWWIIQDKKMRAARGEELQLLELSSWVSQRGPWASPAACHCHPAATPHGVRAAIAHLRLTSKSAKKDKEGKENRENKEKKIQLQFFLGSRTYQCLRLQDISVSMQNSFLCTTYRGKAHFGVFVVKGTFLMWNSDSQCEKKTFGFETKYLSSQLILILHLDSSLNSWG